MTADDTVPVPRELAERLSDALTPQEWSPGCQERIAEAKAGLDAILNPPPEFDELAAVLHFRRHGSYLDMNDELAVRDWRHEAERVLAALRAAGWEMVRADELAALRGFIGRVVEDTTEGVEWRGSDIHTVTREAILAGGWHVGITEAEADVIRKAKAAQR